MTGWFDWLRRVFWGETKEQKQGKRKTLAQLTIQWEGGSKTVSLQKYAYEIVRGPKTHIMFIEDNSDLGRIMIPAIPKTNQVSRKHAILGYNPTKKEFWIKDQSRNGTFIGQGTKKKRAKKNTVYYLNKNKHASLANQVSLTVKY